LPIVTVLREDGRREREQRRFVREERGDLGSAFDLLVEAIESAGRSAPSSIEPASARRPTLRGSVPRCRPDRQGVRSAAIYRRTRQAGAEADVVGEEGHRQAPAESHQVFHLMAVGFYPVFSVDARLDVFRGVDDDRLGERPLERGAVEPEIPAVRRRGELAGDDLGGHGARHPLVAFSGLPSRVA